MSPTVRRIHPDEAVPYRETRLRALAGAPTAFATTYAEAASRPPAGWDERVRADAAGDVDALFVATNGDEFCGLIGGRRSAEAPVEVVSMWVDPEWRRTGVATQLLQAVADWAGGLGDTAMALSVTEGNAPAIALYERFGFVFTGESQPHPSYPGLRELWMRRTL